MKKWTGCALIVLVFAALILLASAVGQSAPDSTPNAPGYELSQAGFDARYRTPASRVSPSLQSPDHTDVKLDELPDSPGTGSDSSNSGAIVQSTRKTTPDTRVKWRVANQESLLYTGIMHTFNLWTEAGTRDSLYGPWLNNYLDSVR